MCEEPLDWEEVETISDKLKNKKSETVDEKIERYMEAMVHLRNAVESMLDIVINHEERIGELQSIVNKLVDEELSKSKKKEKKKAPGSMYG